MLIEEEAGTSPCPWCNEPHPVDYLCAKARIVLQQAARHAESRSYQGVDRRLRDRRGAE